MKNRTWKRLIAFVMVFALVISNTSIASDASQKDINKEISVDVRVEQIELTI